LEDWNIKTEGEFKYVETGGEGIPLVLLHGLMGALSNFEGIIDHFRKSHNVVIPLLPIFDLPLRKLSVSGLVEYVERFIDFKEYEKVHVLGNSLGGHIAQLYTMKRPDKVKSMILTGSSGLFESAMGSSFPKRGNYEYIKNKAESVFYDPAVATKELVDEIFDIVNNRNKAIRIIATAKSAVRHNLGDKLHEIHTPTLLVWGQQDEVTPAWVGEKFHELISTSELHLVEKCGHAPMMERPDEFNRILEDFLYRIEA
jgi:2-hydroxy-6-oxonona-2,4-dienedioate hydrolase